MKLRKLTLIVLAAAIPMAAFADLDSMKKRLPDIVAAKDKGLVGEQPDGMLGALKDSPATKALVEAENKDRLEEYTKRSAEQKQPIETFVKVLGEARIRQEKDGRFIRNAEGNWEKKK